MITYPEHTFYSHNRAMIFKGFAARHEVRMHWGSWSGECDSPLELKNQEHMEIAYVPILDRYFASPIHFGSQIAAYRAVRAYLLRQGYQLEKQTAQSQLSPLCPDHRISLSRSDYPYTPVAYYTKRRLTKEVLALCP